LQRIKKDFKCQTYENRFKSIDSSVDELEYLNKGLNIKNITIKDLSFEDRNIISKKNELEIFANEIINRKLDIRYAVHFRANYSKHCDEKTLEKLRISGLNDCLVGIESFVEKELEFFGKGVTTKENQKFIELLRKHNIEPSCSFMFINPLSTFESVLQNVGVAHHLNLTYFLPPMLNILIVHKNTLIYDELKKLELIDINPSQNNSYIVNLKYRNKRIKLLSDIFHENFSNKKIWDLTHPVKLLSADYMNFLGKFNGRLFFNNNLKQEIVCLLKKICKYNYEFLLGVIKNCEEDKYSEAKKLFEKYQIDFSKNFKKEVINVRISLIKEFKANEIFESRKII